MPPKSRALKNAQDTFLRLKQAHPDAHIVLEHHNPFELIVAVVLSAQTTDVAVNKAMPKLMARYRNAAALGRARAEQVEPLIHSTGTYRQKARNIVALAQKLTADFGGEVPRTVEQLTTLPGVGRKTANVVLGAAYQIAQGVAVDTHVQRVAQRLGWTTHREPEEIERSLMKLFASEDWIMVTHVLIFHGRRICTARAPNCVGCAVNDVCPSAFHAQDVGRKGKPAKGRAVKAPSPHKGRAVKAAKGAKGGGVKKRSK